MVIAWRRLAPACASSTERPALMCARCGYCPLDQTARPNPGAGPCSMSRMLLEVRGSGVSFSSCSSPRWAAWGLVVTSTLASRAQRATGWCGTPASGSKGALRTRPSRGPEEGAPLKNEPPQRWHLHHHHRRHHHGPAGWPQRSTEQTQQRGSRRDRGACSRSGRSRTLGSSISGFWSPEDLKKHPQGLRRMVP